MEYSIQALKVGECKVPGPLVFFNAEYDRLIDLYCYVWLIQGAEKPILVDTEARNWDLFNEMTRSYIPGGVRSSPEEELKSQLKRYRVDPQEVSWIFLTHLHYDHSTGVHLFPNARVVVSKRGFLEALSSPGGPSSIPRDFMEGLIEGWPQRLLLAEDEKEIVPGISTFWIGGHSPCSQAICVNTSKGMAVFSGDTIYTYRNLEDNIPIGAPYSLVQCIEAMERIKKRATIILPGHDPVVLQRYPGGVIV